MGFTLLAVRTGPRYVHRFATRVTAGFADPEAAVLGLCDVDDPSCSAWRDRPSSGPVSPAAYSQKVWSASIDNHALSGLCHSTTGRDNVGLKFLCCGNVLPWLAAPPSRALDTGCGPRLSGFS